MRALFFTLITLVLAVRSVVADIFPHWDVYWMSADADAILLGEQTNGDEIKVLKWLRAPLDAKLTQQQLNIRGLGKHSKKINAFWSKLRKTDSKLLTTRRFVAFLERIDGSWESIATIDDSGLCGSCGLIWIQEGQCYRYSQVMNPGPYDLFEASDNKMEKDLMAAIEIGLKDAEGWHRILAMKDNSARASALAEYTMASTSPENPRSTYRFRVREPLRSIGGTAVVALRNQIAMATPEDSLNEVVLILYDIGRDAKEAVPDLITLLKDDRRVNLCYVLSALRTTADARAIVAIRPFLKHENAQVREEAEKAIAALELSKTYKDGADQPATDLEPEPKRKEKPKPESEGRSQ